MEEKSFMTVEEVATELRVSKFKAYQVCEGTERRIAETRVYDSSGACKHYFLS